MSSVNDPARVWSLTESRYVAASPQDVYSAVSNVKRMGEWSPECTGARGKNISENAFVGMKFVGLNKHGKYSWFTNCEVVIAEPGVEFAFDVKVVTTKIARWGYRFEAQGEGTLVTEYWRDLKPTKGFVPAFESFVERLSGYGPAKRAEFNREGIKATLDSLEAAFSSARSS